MVFIQFMPLKNQYFFADSENLEITVLRDTDSSDIADACPDNYNIYYPNLFTII